MHPWLHNFYAANSLILCLLLVAFYIALQGQSLVGSGNVIFISQSSCCQWQLLHFPLGSVWWDDLRQFVRSPKNVLKPSTSPASSHCSYRLLWTSNGALQSPWWSHLAHSSARKKGVIKTTACFPAKWASCVIALCLGTIRAMLPWLETLYTFAWLSWGVKGGPVYTQSVGKGTSR